MKVEYSANNSGGSWWLKDADGKALENAGWTVAWGGEDFCGSEFPSLRSSPSKAPNTCATEIRNGRPWNTCEGHRRYTTYAECVASGEKWLGALAKGAHKDFPSLRDAIKEWEHVTGQDASDEGCNCCGAPHSFSAREGEKYEYASGDAVADLLVPEAKGLSRRALAQRLAETDR